MPTPQENLPDGTAVVIRIAAGGADGYDVQIAPGLLGHPDQLAQKLRALGVGRDRPAVVVSDSNVKRLYGGAVDEALASLGASAGSFVFAAGEASKTPAVLVKALEAFAKAGLTRKGFVIALGGGVAGDLAGLAAALYMRGVACIQIPTSLLAMTDSSVGGKTAVDLPQGKNLMGAFAQPAGVLIDPEALKTLPEREAACGWGEIIKYALLSPSIMAVVEQELLGSPDAGPSGCSAGRSKRPPLPSAALIAEAVELKRRIVEADEKEAGERRLLNLGHTIGHAVESASRFALSHGAAVAIGLCTLVRALHQEGRLSAGYQSALERLVEAAGLPSAVPAALLKDPALDFSDEALMTFMRRDKKSLGSQAVLAMPDESGRAHVEALDWTQLARLLAIGDPRGERRTAR